MEVEQAKKMIEKYGLESFLFWNSIYEYHRKSEDIDALRKWRIMSHEEDMRHLTQETTKLENEMKKLQIEKLRIDNEAAKPKWFLWV